MDVKTTAAAKKIADEMLIVIAAMEELDKRVEVLRTKLWETLDLDPTKVYRYNAISHEITSN